VALASETCRDLRELGRVGLKLGQGPSERCDVGVMRATVLENPEQAVLGRLERLSVDRGQPDLTETLHALNVFLADDLAAVEADLGGIPVRANVVGRSVQHLMTLGGKRLRPLCVVLASRIGREPARGVRALAVAVELVHSATLLHDDVVDGGVLRRGQPAARVRFGNAASVFAGDWLLIEALRRVQSSGVPDVLDRLLSVIDEMIAAEAIQLEHRGKLFPDVDTYFQVVRGKTASLFRWAAYAGARAGGASSSVSESMSAYGEALGLGFQIIDDVLDLRGSSSDTGKTLFADLLEGKTTLPVIFGIEADPSLASQIAELMRIEGKSIDEVEKIRSRLEELGAIERAVSVAGQYVARAKGELENLPTGLARDALLAVAETTLHRKS
jgi:octaprenyl-diphosphate synthase